MNVSLGFLVDLIPAKQRKIVYTVLAVAVALFGMWQAFEGDWLQFVISFATTLVSTLATANTDVQADEKGKVTPSTLDDRVEAGENLDQSESGGRHSAVEIGDTELPRYY